MTNQFTTQEHFNALDRFPDYEESNIACIKTRTLTEREYEAVRFSYKSKLKSLFTRSGLILVLLSVVAVCSIIFSVYDIVKGEPNAWLYLFICCAVNLFMIAISLSAYSERRKQVITEDQQIAPGEVVHTQPVKRAPNNVPFCARHTIALHGSKQIVTIYDRQIKKGKTVLVVINPPPASPYMICVPKNAVDYDLSTSRYEHKEPYTDPAEYADYSIAELEDVVDYISPEENKKIIHKERLLGPFKYGVLSAIWMLFTVAAIVMVVFLIKSYIARQAEVFFPLMIGFLCEIIIEWILCKAVIKKKTSYLDSGILECVVSKKFEDEHINVKCIRVVIPERKQFVNLNVAVFDYKHLSLNERVTLVVKKSTGEVRWIIRK